MRVWAGAVAVVALLSAAGCGADHPLTNDKNNGLRCDSIVVGESSDGTHICLDVGSSVRVSLPGAGWGPVTASGAGLTEMSADTFRGSSRGIVKLTAARKVCPAPSAPGMVSCHALQAWTVTVGVRQP
ncbi:hypothetical protein G3I60_29590 [Streptomyces sp. SID13666]|uniref:hypothetical protein n=1 Tax=unclassified Streptomyces TaxID=2593676 RepID=UPI0013BFAF4C|nr:MULTISPECIES: hypothetical protein [unclassified Streptomyces]NEA58202.1 hypothetical protein [Streptomyces sp. SID13666]NEA73901.1 hypothetical protein [Streptomyces sp. SID13588]